VLQGSVLGSPIFLADDNDVWRNLVSNVRLFADDCTIYRKTTDSSDIDKLQKDLNGSGERAVENELNVNPSRIKQ
jgi:hypothetical protein